MREKGFTAIELLLVLVMIAILASIVAPVVTRSIDRAKESTLKENLFILRKTLDDYYADKGRYPATLEELVKAHYLRQIPADPMTESNTSWVTVMSEASGEQPGIIEVRSGSKLKSSEGVPYEQW